MNRRVFILLGIVLLAAFGIFAASPQPSSATKPANPTEAARLNNLGAAYMNQQLFEKALKAFQDAAAVDPKLQIARLNQGIALLNLGRVDAAKPLLEEAVQRDPKDPHAWYNLGLLYKNSSDTQAAVDAFRRVTEIDSNDPDAWYFLGAAYSQIKQYPQAIDAFQHALKLNPLHASAEFGLSRASQQSGDVAQAREHLQRFQHITQEKLGSPISLAYGEQGQYSRVEESAGAVEKVPAAIPVRFVDVTERVGLRGKSVPAAGNDFASFHGPGACFLEYDGDDQLDIFLPDNGPQGGMGLYRNIGNGKFEEVTKKAGIDATLHGIGCTAGDYDNDGWTDLVVSLNGRVMLLHNEKNGMFKDVTETAAIKSDSFNLGLTFIDYDHDGDLDLYTTRYKVKSQPSSRTGNPRRYSQFAEEFDESLGNTMWRNNGNGTFTDVTEVTGLGGDVPTMATVGTDYNNDRAIDIVATTWRGMPKIGPTIFENPREGKFSSRQPWSEKVILFPAGVTVLDFNHDGWMDLGFTYSVLPGLTLWRNNHGTSFEQVELPKTNWLRAWGVAALDYDNDGWVDLVAVGETREGKGEVRLFRNLGPDGFKDVTTDVGLDKIPLKDARAIITGDYDNDGATDLLITQNHGPAVLLRNQGGNKNNWLRLSLKGLADNKSAIGTKVEIFAGGNRQKFEIAGSSGYLGENSPYLTVGLGQAKQADVVRMLWPTGVLQDEVEVAGLREQAYTELDRRGSSCPTLFVWDGEHYELVGDMLGAGVVGHWVGPGQRNIPRPTEYIKVDRGVIREKDDSHPSQNQGRMGYPMLSFRFMEPLEEVVYLDQVKLLAVDHPGEFEVFPNEYFASNPPYPEFKVVVSRDARPPAGAWDEHGHNVLPDLLAHRYFGDFGMTQFQGFAKPHSLTLDLGEPYRGGPLWLLLHGEVEYFSANSMYAASQAGVEAIAPYVEALDANGKWARVVDDMGFPAGGARTMTADLSGKLPRGTQKIRITTNLQIYWDGILIDRTVQNALVAPPSRRLSGGRPARRAEGETPSGQPARCRRYGTGECLRLTAVPLAHADLRFHGFPLKIENQPPGNVRYVYEKSSPTGPYTRPSGAYTRYGDVLPLLTALDDRLAVFGSGDEVTLDFDPSALPALPQGWVRDYFFVANGYEKDMDFYAFEGNSVAPLPFRGMGTYPYPGKSFPLDETHLNYLLDYNTRHVSGNEPRGFSYDYPSDK